MQITPTATLSEVAVSMPASLRVFERYGMDYCCGGGKNFEQACQEKGITTTQFLEEVNAAAQVKASQEQRDWDTTSLSELIAHILGKHHRYLHSELPRLSELLNKVVQAHGDKHPQSLLPLHKIFADMRTELEDHMWKEENILFPLIQQMERAPGAAASPGPCGKSVQGPVRVMMMEHDSAGNALSQMRRLTSDFSVPPDGCASYQALFDGFKVLEADLHEHIHLENNILFPKALRLEQSAVSN